MPRKGPKSKTASGIKGLNISQLSQDEALQLIHPQIRFVSRDICRLPTPLSSSLALCEVAAQEVQPVQWPPGVFKYNKYYRVQVSCVFISVAGARWMNNQSPLKWIIQKAVYSSPCISLEKLIEPLYELSFVWNGFFKQWLEGCFLETTSCSKWPNIESDP